MTSKATWFSISALLGLIPAIACAQLTQWAEGAGGNGHYYEAVGVQGGITWSNASLMASNRGGYLATITSSNENEFVFNLVSQDTSFWFHSGAGTWWGPWLGGVQAFGAAEPANGWGWISGEPFVYSNWTAGQPNNNEPLNGGENRIQFGGQNIMASTWNDLNETNKGYARSFIVEYDSDWGTGCLPAPAVAVSRPVPTVFLLEVAGAPGINYALENSKDLLNWTRVATNRSSSGQVWFPYTFSATAPNKYFRVFMLNSGEGLGGSFIFDGKSLAGWEGDTLEAFRLADCSIIGGSFSKAFAENRFLCTTRQYTNFILRLQFKLVGTGGMINSGVQFRSQRIAGQQVAGYQADIGEGYWGNLWDEGRRNVSLAEADQGAVSAILKQNDWNDYRIQAEGARVQLWINGHRTIDYTESDISIPRYGIIGLQVVPGGFFEASFRQISVEVLP